jgi:hypothetical protein
MNKWKSKSFLHYNKRCLFQLAKTNWVLKLSFSLHDCFESCKTQVIKLKSFCLVENDTFDHSVARRDIDQS